MMAEAHGLSRPTSGTLSGRRRRSGTKSYSIPCSATLRC